MINLNIKLPDNFLNEEIRCDYKVSSKMKEIWAIEIDILVKILEVCKKHNIKIFMYGGSMLGTIRHQGFIPWDDDIDLALDRENYDKLCSVAYEFKQPYFFQTEQTDKDSRRGHIQVRRSDTCAIMEYKYRDKEYINQGIFVDIFPLDNIPDDPKEEDSFRNEVLKLKKKYALSNLYFSDYIKSTNIIKTIIKSIYFPILKISDKLNHYYDKFESTCRRYNNTKCRCISNVGFDPLNKKYNLDKTELDNIVWLDYEFIKVPVLGNYDKILTKVFGDYHKYVKNASYHSGILFDTDKSYKEIYASKKLA